MSPGSFLEWRAQSSAFERLAAVDATAFNLTGDDEPERLPAARVSEGVFDMLGVPPTLGRGFTTAEMESGNDLVVVLSHGLWERRFGGDPEVIGEAITLSNRRYTVVGVAARGLAFPKQETQLWTPLALPGEDWESYGAHYLRVTGRLRVDATIEQARTEIRAIVSRIEDARPDTNTGWSVTIVPLHEVIVGDARPALLVLAAAVGLVLLIACVNVANMLLAHAAVRETEIAIRTALGAGRRRIVRQLFTESLILAAAGAGGGVLLAAWGTTALPALAPAGLPRIDQVGLDGWTLLFTLVVAVVTAVVFGLVPALQTSRHAPTASLRDSGRGVSAGRHRRLMRSSLVVIEVALAVMLLIGAGLLLRSFSALQNTDPGFDPNRALLAQVDLPATTGDAERRAFYLEVVARIGALPGVVAVGATQAFPITANYVLGFQIEGRPPSPPGETPNTAYYAVTPAFFQASGIPLLRGRLFTDDDRDGGTRVAVINQAMADRYFPDEDPIGQAIHVANGPETFREIVGVVGNTKQFGLAAEAPVQTYEPLAQQPFGGVSLVIRTSGDPATLANAIRAEVRAIDSDQPVSNIRTLDSVISDSVARERFSALLLGIFAAVALALAAIGIYGVMAYTVAQRTHEMGIRMALGAEATDVRWLVMQQGMRLALAGIGVGVLASFAATRVLDSLLFGVSSTDPMTFVVTPLLLAGAALVATYIPAHRATRVDPLLALRGE